MLLKNAKKKFHLTQILYGYCTITAFFAGSRKEEVHLIYHGNMHKVTHNIYKIHKILKHGTFKMLS